jgi:hypothetical protein
MSASRRASRFDSWLAMAAFGATSPFVQALPTDRPPLRADPRNG